ncbi:phospholipase D-like domain-containing protein [Sandarakinorhabdus sp. DWP1-3-1]|uniref:phospholipase D-like domain-containing protein n=1 Tax=Sandarakinorhabdus sp. DWP1-3-1 TaxID=2804627 RepID=UPI003CEB531E
MSVIVDAANYFVAARSAMRKARHRIMLIGWDFDTRIRLSDSPTEPDQPTVGDFIWSLVEANPELDIYLLRWDLGALKLITRGSTALTLLKWMSHPRIHTKLDGTHPTGASHHQKICVVDDCMAFCGGIDMTGGRWDTREHKDDDPRRVGPDGTPCPPWHDATSALQGPVAAALGDLCRDRWQRAGCDPLEPVPGVSDCWPDDLEVDFENVEVAIARSEPLMPDRAAVLEIERLYLDQIAGARHFIYAESQYFASRRIAEAIARRLDEDDGPEIVVINPLTAQGWLEPIAMDTARARLFEALRRRDRHGRLRLYHPFTTGGEPIYVHAKILIIDDAVLRVGSSNINNRSLRLDTECDIAIHAAHGDNAARAAAIRNIKIGLIAEHVDATVDEVAATIERTGSLIATIEALRPTKNCLRPYELPDVDAVAKWLADNEVLDPEGPDEMFESVADRGLFRGIHLWRHAS